MNTYSGQLQVQSTKTASIAHGIKTLVYGPAGIGKTRLVATCPKPLLISAEAGVLSLREYDIPMVEINELDDLNKVYDALMGPFGNDFYTVCLDSISEIAEKVLANAKASTKDGRQAYGALADQMWEVIRKFRDLPGKAVLMTAKASQNKDQTTGVTRWGPSLPGQQLESGISYYFDEVFYYNAFRGTQGEFKALCTRASLQHEAKDRSGALDEYENPDMGAIFTKIYNATTGA